MRSLSRPGALVLCLLLPCCGGERPTLPSSGREIGREGNAQASQPDMVVFLVSGWRADLEEPAAESSLLAALSDEPRLRLTSAYAQTPSAFTSFGSLLTGRYPSAIPLCGLADLDGEGSPVWCAAMPEERRTLPEVLALYGYQTALISGGLPAVERLAGDFHERIALEPGEGGTQAESLLALAQPWWEAHRDSPRLLVVVLSDLLLHQRPDLVPGLGWGVDPPRGLRPLAAKDPELFRRVVGNDRDELIRAHTQEAARVGRVLQQLSETLRGDGERPRTTVLSALCGEDLAEAQGGAKDSPTFGADRLVLDRTVHVPLVLFPVQQTSTVDQPVELVDIFPTLASLAGAEPPAGLPGQDLLAPGFGSDPDAVAYAEHGDMLALRQGPWLFTFRAMFHHGTSLDPALTTTLVNLRGRPVFSTLHHVEDDPLQRDDRFADEPAVAERLGARLAEVRTGLGAPPGGSLTARQLWELRLTDAEGYW